MKRKNKPGIFFLGKFMSTFGSAWVLIVNPVRNIVQVLELLLGQQGSKTIETILSYTEDIF